MMVIFPILGDGGPGDRAEGEAGGGWGGGVQQGQGGAHGHQPGGQGE